MKERQIEFYSEGILLSAVYRVPPGMKRGAQRPGIVCCHGYSGNKDIHTAKAAIALSRAGYVTLCFDHRGFGKSAGTPGRMIPMEQVNDIRDALTYLGAQAEVDPELLGLWGQSWGGANVTHVAAIDPRVKCTVSLSGIGDGERWLRSIRNYAQWRAFLKRVETDRVQRVRTGKSEEVDLFEIMAPDPATEQYYNAARSKHPKWVWQRPLETADATMSFKPVELAHRIAPRAIMFMHTEGDYLVPMEESISMYDAALEPKRLRIFRGVSHQDAYHEPVHGQIMAEAIAWYKHHLSRDERLRTICRRSAGSSVERAPTDR